MAISLRVYASEELEIEKHVRHEHNASEDEFDRLYDDMKADAETQLLNREESEEPVEEPIEEETKEDSVPSSEEPDTASEEEEVEEDTTEGDQPATEAFKTLYAPAITSLTQTQIRHALETYQTLYPETAHLAQEEGFIDGTMGVATAIGRGIATGARTAYDIGSFAYRNLIKNEMGEDMILTKLAKIGYEYGKTGLLHVAKGVFYALSQVGVGLAAGTKLLIRTIKKRMKSYDAFQSKLDKANDLYNVIDKTALKKKEDYQDLYDDQLTIAMLKVGSSVQFTAHLKTLDGLIETYGKQVPRYVAGVVGSSKALMNAVMSGRVDINSLKYVDRMKIQGFSEKAGDGETMVLQYSKGLPGDKLFCIDVPNPSQSDYDLIKQAYRDSRAYLKIMAETVSPDECRYLSYEEIPGYIDTLQRLINHGKEMERQLKTIEGYRKQLKPSFGSYIDYLTAEKRDITVRESMAEFVSLKVAFMDHVVIGSYLTLHDYNTSVLSAGMSYLKASISKYTS